MVQEEMSIKAFYIFLAPAAIFFGGAELFVQF